MLGPFLRTDLRGSGLIKRCNNIYDEWVSVNYPMHRTFLGH